MGVAMVFSTPFCQVFVDKCSRCGRCFVCGGAFLDFCCVQPPGGGSKAQ